jgi:hypothetical protein
MEFLRSRSGPMNRRKIILCIDFFSGSLILAACVRLDAPAVVLIFEALYVPSRRKSPYVSTAVLRISVLAPLVNPASESLR